MKNFASALLIPLTILASTTFSIAYAQQAGQKALPDGQSGPSQPSATSGTAPDHMGKSGWTGGSTGASTGTAQTRTGINADSEYATGEDLRGPPAHFPASKTPE